MTYRNRDLIRKPICLLRGSKEEQEKLTRLAERMSNGGAVAPTLLEILLKAADELEMADERMHSANATHRSRVDRNVFGGLIAA